MGSLDLEIARWIADHRTAGLTRLCRGLEDIGTSSWVFLVLAAGSLALIVRFRVWTSLLGVGTSLFVTGLLTVPLKAIVDRPRPPAELALTTLAGPSMPSTHAILTSALVTAVVLAPWWTSAAWRRATAVVGVLGCVITGGAMVYLGGHWVSDVLVGWLLGAGITAAGMIGWGLRWRSRRPA